MVRAVVQERDRAPLEGAPIGDGYRLVVELFAETAGRARIATVSLDVRRPAGGALDSWRIAGGEGNLEVYEFQNLIQRRCLDVLQPDVTWCGGISGLRRVAIESGVRVHEQSPVKALEADGPAVRVRTAHAEEIGRAHV